jgi:hypothetical protein
MAKKKVTPADTQAPVEKTESTGNPKVALIRKGVTVFRHRSDLEQYLADGWKEKE